ncbi:MAG: hypothetical protein RSF67_01055, partial [Clostridia bacterium]
DLLNGCNYKNIITIPEKKSNFDLVINDDSDSKSIEELLYDTLKQTASTDAEFELLLKLNNKYFQLANKEE